MESGRKTMRMKKEGLKALSGIPRAAERISRDEANLEVSPRRLSLTTRSRGSTHFFGIPYQTHEPSERVCLSASRSAKTQSLSVLYDRFKNPKKALPGLGPRQKSRLLLGSEEEFQHVNNPKHELLERCPARGILAENEKPRLT
ncbi:hypothetical protein DY000_02052964 [Brassica cretica]|uniref:Uncharacterized protein n=1 Tax=Brassica cretica TaxID=69181 RepID=A0ABQ7AK89_BRACR|nr:hypothetical protein DY000_02052964 [Brassica cretica]